MNKLTAAQLLDAVQMKHRGAALLREVSMNDEEELVRWRHALVKQSPSHEKDFMEQGLNYSLDSQGDPLVLPEGYDPNLSIFKRRIDGLLWNGQTRTAIEVKVSRSDFYRESDDKKRIWRKHTDKFVYLTPKGLLRKEEIPPGCGLWEGSIRKNGVVEITVRCEAALNEDVQPLPDSMMKYFVYRIWASEVISPFAKSSRAGERRKSVHPRR